MVKNYKVTLQKRMSITRSVWGRASVCRARSSADAGTLAVMLTTRYSTIGQGKSCTNIHHYAPPRTVLQQAASMQPHV